MGLEYRSQIHSIGEGKKKQSKVVSRYIYTHPLLHEGRVKNNKELKQNLIAWKTEKLSRKTDPLPAWKVWQAWREVVTEYFKYHKVWMNIWIWQFDMGEKMACIFSLPHPLSILSLSAGNISYNPE